MLINEDMLNEQVNEMTVEIPPAHIKQFHQLPIPAL